MYPKKKEIYRCSIISFDIFDTLLLRPYLDPQEVWKVLEEQEEEKGFAKARKEVDAKTYKLSSEQNRETTIEEAYELIPKYRYLMHKEMELERKVLRANPEMLNLWNELGMQGKRRVIVSDMYLPADFIKSVLRENGIDGWDGFYLSRDYNARKTTGKLFEIMLNKEGVKASDVLHIGDNMWSDVKMAEKVGLNTLHYKKISERFFDICPFTRKIDERLAGALATGWNKFTFEHNNATYWNRLGYIMGGVLGYIYVSWIVETAKRLGKKRLLFIARDGYIWQKICNELYPEIETDYIYAPRMVSVAVLGAIGSDPVAIADRRNYISEKLLGVDLNKVREDYKLYISQYTFDEHTAIVDGCSSGFSAQRLIEEVVGHKVFAFYLLSMAKMHNAAALYSTNGYSMPFQMLSEFLFGSPEAPIREVKDGQALYNEISKEEAFKMSVSEEIASGAIECAKQLKENYMKVLPEDWIKYADSYMNNLTEEDITQLQNAKNAGDVQQKTFNSIVWNPYRKFHFWVEKWGRATIYTYSIVFCFKFRLYIGRGVKLNCWNMKPRIGNIAYA